MALLTELNAQSSTIIMVTHEDDIAAYAQRVIHFLERVHPFRSVERSQFIRSGETA